MRHFHARRADLDILRPDQAGLRQLPAQCWHQGLGQHHHAVLRTLALPHDQRALRKVRILDAQLQGLGDAQAGAVEQLRQQQVLPRKPGQHPAERTTWFHSGSA